MVAAATTLGLMPILTRIYQPSSVALHYLFLQMASALVVLQTLRFELLVQVPRTERQAMTLVSLCVALGLLMGLMVTPVIWFCRTWFADWLEMPALVQFAWLLPLYSLLLGASFAMESMVQRRGAYSRASLGEMAHRLSFAGIVVIAGLFAAQASTLILASIASLLLKTVLLSRSFGGFMARATASIDDLREGLRSYLGRAVNLVAAHAMQLVSVILPLLFIAQSYGAERLGYYSLVASTLNVPVALLGTSIGKVYYQRAAALIYLGEPVAELWTYTATRLIIIAIPAFGLLALLAHWLYPTVFGSSWAPAGEVARLMCPAFFAGFISVPLDRNAVLADKRSYILVWNGARLAGAAVTILLAKINNWQFADYILCISFTSTVLYAVDLGASRHFLGQLKTTRERDP